MAQRPTGTVTFLFTDIEGSARLWEREPGGMARAIATHDALIRARVERNGGFVFKTVGDAVCAAFSTAPEAVRAAIEVQEELARTSWGSIGTLRVRTALHTGAAQEQGGDYLGPTVNRVARLVGVGHGGQILLSQAVCNLIGEGSPEPETAWTLRDLGFHRLKDLLEPEHVYQLVAPSLPDEFPPLRSLNALPNNLPRELTSFIGREEQIAEIRDLLPRTHLLTLTGPGGCGKTRLAIQVAAEILHEYPDGVWLAELAALSDPALVPQALASQLRVPEEPSRGPLASLTDFLQPRELLLVLDNCEHLVEGCAQIAETLLRACPRLRILATSREGLGVTGETVWIVPSLALPPDEPAPPGLGALRECESVCLFLERAAAAVPRLTFSDAHAPAIARICRRLDGIPLAIELAAVRVKVLPVEQIALRLDDRFRLLTGGGRTALPRHQTLRAAIDWSHELLTEAEKTLLRRLSVFAGGWTLDAAESVCAGSEIEGGDVLDLLARLADRSLVSVDQERIDAGPAGEFRYRLLETVREYAGERLREAGEGEEVREQHRLFYMGFAEQAEPQLAGADQGRWLNRLQREQDNFRAALAWSVDSESRLRLAGALWRFWYQRGPLAEGRGWLEGALARSPGCAPAARAKALSGAGNLAAQQGDYAAARAFHEQSLTLRREMNDPAGIAGSLNNLGIVARHQGEAEVARDYFDQSLAINRATGNQALTAAALVNLAVIAQEQGDPGTAEPWLQESRAIYEQLGDRWRVAITLQNLGKVALHRHRLEEAQQLFRAGLTAFQEIGDRSSSVMCLNGLAMVASDRGDRQRAARLFAAEEAARSAAGAPIPLSDRAEVQRYIQTVREGLPGPEFCRAWDEGLRMTLDEAIQYALG